jgi:hypothetical protein
VRGVYNVPMANVTANALANAAMVFINPGTTTTLQFLRCSLSQQGSTTSAQQGVYVGSQVTAFPTLTSTTPVAAALIDQASKITGGTAGAAGTSGTNASAIGAGTKTTYYSDNFNVLNGWLWVPTPAETILASASGASGWGVYTTGAVATTGNWSSNMTYQEW